MPKYLSSSAPGQGDVADQHHLASSPGVIREVRAGGLAAFAGVDPLLMMARRTFQLPRRPAYSFCETPGAGAVEDLALVPDEQGAVRAPPAALVQFRGGRGGRIPPSDQCRVTGARSPRAGNS